jgi:FKBP-type peptidyl-prolyl cis-trans isomerase FklB
MGTGAKPEMFDSVTVHYHGTKLDGSVFDSSKGADAVTFNVAQVVPGFSEGLQLFPAGSKFKLYIPEYLAYGERVQNGSIKPFETLIFEVELISFKKGKAPQQQQLSMEQLMQMQMQQ